MIIKKNCLVMNITNASILPLKITTCTSTELLIKKMFANSVRNKCLTQILKLVEIHACR